MKNFKINILLAAACVSVGFLTACDNEPLTYENGNGATGSDVYFSSNAQTEYELNAGGGSFTVTVNRGPAGPALTLPITIKALQEGDEAIISYPSNITFEEGSVTADISIEYAAMSETSKDYLEVFGYLISIPEEYQSPFGSSDLEINVYYPQPWSYLGTGTFTDEAWWISEDSETIKVEFYRNDLDPNLYRINNPYWAWTGDKDSYFEFRVLQEGQTYLGQTVTLPNIVAYADFKIDYDPEYEDDVYLVFPGRFSMPVDDWSFNHVISYQDNGVPAQIKISPMYYMFNNGGYNYTKDEPITIIFPDLSAK